MRFYFIAAVMMGVFWLLFENGTLQGSDYFWKTSRFLASEKQELQIELPVPLEPLLKEDEGYIVYQAEGENIFVDLHSEPLYLPEDRARYTQAGPQKRYALLHKSPKLFSFVGADADSFAFFVAFCYNKVAANDVKEIRLQFTKK